MKCIPQTDPVSAMRAANGPWYQSVSKVSMPRPQTSWRPVAQWAATKAAARSANTSWGRGIAGAGGADELAGWRLARAIREELATHAEPDAEADRERRDQQDGRNEDPEGAEQLQQDREQRDAEHRLGQAGGCPSQPGSSRARRRTAARAIGIATAASPTTPKR